MKSTGNWRLVWIILCVCSLWNCSNENKTSVSLESLEELLSEIQGLSLSVVCEDASEWRYTALGSKPCGGPTLYIAYSSKIDTVAFLNKVKDYTEMQRKFNLETGALSDCAITEEPDDVNCIDGEPVFSYRLE